MKGLKRPPLIDFSPLRSRPAKVLLLSAGLAAFGLYTPVFFLVSLICKALLNKFLLNLPSIFARLMYVLIYSFLLVRLYKDFKKVWRRVPLCCFRLFWGLPQSSGARVLGSCLCARRLSASSPNSICVKRLCWV